MIILIGGEKGGTGKTTLATNLIAQHITNNNDTLLIDTDKQGSASTWTQSRDEEGHTPRIPCIQKFGKSLTQEIQDLKTRYQDIIIDAGGRDSIELRASLVIADKIYIPVQASQYDVWTLDQMNELVNSAQALNPALKAYVIINRASTNHNVKEAEEAATFLTDYENLIFSNIVIRDRIAFRKSAGEGQAVFEFTPKDKKAIEELDNLYNHIF